jgi:hypothetical protein
VQYVCVRVRVGEREREREREREIFIVVYQIRFLVGMYVVVIVFTDVLLHKVCVTKVFLCPLKLGRKVIFNTTM